MVSLVVYGTMGVSIPVTSCLATSAVSIYNAIVCISYSTEGEALSASMTKSPYSPGYTVKSSTTTSGYV